MMAQNLPPYTQNRYILGPNHQLQQHVSQQHQQQQQVPPPTSCGYYSSQHQPPPSAAAALHPSAQHNSLSRTPHNSYMMGCFPQNPNGWTGIPLISTAPRRPRKTTNFSNAGLSISGIQKPRILISNNTTDFDENAITRLAIHAHGAPLILAGRYRNRIQKRDGMKPIMMNGGSPMPKKLNETLAVGSSPPNNGIADNCSAAVQSAAAIVDDSPSSGGGVGSTQETCLPRIIKPRKRRKKDRKPQNTTVVCLPETIASNQSYSVESNPTHVVTREQMPPSISMRLPISSTVIDLPNSSECSSLQRNDYSKPPTSDAETIDIFKLQSSGEESIASACCCQICDPACRIWAFPLRRSCSDNSAELEMQKRKDVGVIGSNRSSSTNWRSSSKTADTGGGSNRSLFRNGSFSDSGDSGCDLLNGFNFGDDQLFYNGTGGSGSNQLSPSPIGDDRGFIDFPTAETLLTESINEISKKLMETVDLRSDLFSSDSSSVFSDSVLSDDMLFNIENLTRNYVSANGGNTSSCNSNNNNNNNNNNSKNINYQNSTTFYSSGSDLLNDLYNHNHLISNSISNLTGNYLLTGGDDNNNNNNNRSINNSNNGFVMFHEKDRENEIFNCFDMVWSRDDGSIGVGCTGIGSSNNISGNNNNNCMNANFFSGSRQLLPIEEQRIQLQTTG